MKSRQTFIIIAAMMSAFSAGPAAAQISDDVVRIGVLTDLSGPYATLTGAGSVQAARMAIEDVGGTVLGKRIEVISADHQNKPDVAVGIARQWFDVDKVDAIVDLTGSPIALAVIKLAAEKNRAAIVTGALVSRITSEDCTPTSSQWIVDTYVTASSVATGITKRGGASWFFLTVDNAGGHSLREHASNAVVAAGGKVVGEVAHPLNMMDFSSALLVAQSSGAQVVGLANAGGDTVNAIKSATEFGLTKKQTVAATLFTLADLHALGLASAKGMYTATSFYWDANDDTRAWSRRFMASQGRMPDFYHAGMYAGITHYLQSIKAIGTDDGTAVVAKMKQMPVETKLFKSAQLRENGQFASDVYLVRVKSPEESKYSWDYFAIEETVPADQAFLPLSKSKCPLIRN